MPCIYIIYMYNMYIAIRRIKLQTIYRANVEVEYYTPAAAPESGPKQTHAVGGIRTQLDNIRL